MIQKYSLVDLYSKLYTQRERERERGGGGEVMKSRVFYD